jgi:hypothetical protein
MHQRSTKIIITAVCNFPKNVDKVIYGMLSLTPKFGLLMFRQGKKLPTNWLATKLSSPTLKYCQFCASLGNASFDISKTFPSHFLVPDQGTHI